ncbi:hypothetical protein E4U53_005731 [Claviceps sorghi]|nr:hypothetical protein E4U53_005731 [Claviceps sorghi]
MKAALLLSLASGLVAGRYNRSKPFNLVIESSDKELNGQAFQACHTGAAIESICLIKDSKATFYLETSEGRPDTEGVLEWVLQSRPPIPSFMSFFIDPASNVALPLFEPGYGRQVGFDEKSELYIASSVDDTKLPPKATPLRAVKSWYVCDTYFEGYSYKTLAWVLGIGKPQNPSCVKVQVKRKFI